MKRRFTLITLVALALAFLGLPIQAQNYTFRDLGTLGGPYSAAFAVNNMGQVVGEAMWSSSGRDLTRDVHAFYWSSGTGILDMGTLGGQSSRALGLNSQGEAVGEAEYNPAVFGYHAFYWNRATGMRDMNSLLSPADAVMWTLTSAQDINDRRQVVGTGQVTINGSTVNHAILLDLNTGALTDLGTLGGLNSNARAINENGWVVGASSEAGGNVGFLYTGSLPLIGLLPMTVAYDVNEAGAITGVYNNGVSQRACYRAPDGSLTDLGTLGSPYGIWALALNNAPAPTVVGSARISKGATQYPRAFRWQYGNAAMTDLNKLTSNRGKFILRSASGVSDSGLIAGKANATRNENSLYDRAFLLTPQ